MVHLKPKICLLTYPLKKTISQLLSFSLIRNSVLIILYPINSIFKFAKQKKACIDNTFSILVNVGPGSFSGIRTSLAIAKGLEISKKVKLFGVFIGSLDRNN